MKISTSLIAALVFAGASFGSSAALAVDISSNPTALAVLDGTAYFGDTFALNNEGNTFADQFRFSVTDVPYNLDTAVTSFARTADMGLDITGLNLYSRAGALITAGTLESSGAIDIWTLRADALPLGNYYLQVSGTMVSNTAGTFGGSVMLAPVPEPATYGMMLAGLGVVGMLVRRRKAASQA
jgi:hypothetical protein